MEEEIFSTIGLGFAMHFFLFGSTEIKVWID